MMANTGEHLSPHQRIMRQNYDKALYKWDYIPHVLVSVKKTPVDLLIDIHVYTDG